MERRLDCLYKVLIVDDEGYVLEILPQHLRRDVRQGRYQLFFAHTGWRRWSAFSTNGMLTSSARTSMTRRNLQNSPADDRRGGMR